MCGERARGVGTAFLAQAALAPVAPQGEPDDALARDRSPSPASTEEGFLDEVPLPRPSDQQRVSYVSL